MKHLFVPALLGLAMAGCTSSEPQNLAGAPVAEMALPAPATPSFNATNPSAFPPAYDRQPALAAPTAPTPAARTTSVAGFPPPPACDPGAECAAPARVKKCRTVGSVTTCDVPPDPATDSTRYTN